MIFTHSLYLTGRLSLRAFRAAALPAPVAPADEADVQAYSEILAKIRDQSAVVPERISALYKFYQQMGRVLKKKHGIDLNDAEGSARFEYALRNPLTVIRQQSSFIADEVMPDYSEGYNLYLAVQRQKLQKLEPVLPYLLMKVNPSVLRSTLPAGEDLSDICAFAQEHGFPRFAVLLGPPLPVPIVSPPRPE